MFKKIKQTGKKGTECLVRALMNTLDKTRDEVIEYAEDNGFMQTNSNSFLSFSMRKNNFVENKEYSNSTIKEFASKFNSGKAVAIVGQGYNDHAVSIIDGNYLDTYDSGSENIIKLYIQE